MECNQAQPLIPSYLDGELSEAQAAPLRRHLLDCQPCRAGAQSEKNMKRWFSATNAVAVPKGFAARVARRAFAGDTGEPRLEPSLTFVPAVAAALPGAATEASEDRALRFVLQVTAAAALIVIALSLGLRGLSLPSGTSLSATDGRAEIGVQKALERLDRMNQEEAAKAPAATSKTVEIQRP
jgi:anti-sigma factor RsiW